MIDLAIGQVPIANWVSSATDGLLVLLVQDLM